MPDETISENADLIAGINARYDQFNAYLDGLSEQRLTQPTDAAGWTAKDHIIHLAMWAKSMIAVVEKQSRWEALGISLDIWRTIVDGYDQINAEIQRQHRDMPLPEVRAEFARAHQALMAKIAGMTAADLELPYSVYQPAAVDETYPLHLYITGNTADHYFEHKAYIDAIVKSVSG